MITTLNNNIKNEFDFKVINEINPASSEAALELEGYLLRRISFSVDRFKSKISFLRVRLSDVNGPKGGRDKMCSVLLTLKPSKKIFVEAYGSFCEMAIDAACDKLFRVVSKSLKIERALRFRSGMMPKFVYNN